MQAGAAGQFGGILVLVLLVLLVCCSVTFFPAYFLWRWTKDKRYPIMWVTCSAITTTVASVATLQQMAHMPKPRPIHEALVDVADNSGTLRVTALRVPNPERPLIHIEIDAENAAEEQQLLGIQCTASSGEIGAVGSEPANWHYIWTVEPHWKGVLSCDAPLPGVAADGKLTVVLAKCKSKTSGPNNWLPANSEALYQNRFELFPKPRPEASPN